jgi:hypothetical protein
MNDDKIASALGLRPLAEVREDEEKNLPVEFEEVAPPAVISEDEDENIQDLETARQNIKNIINTGEDALTEILSVAKQSNSARAFEVVSTMMKTLLDANKDFVDISTKKKFAKEETAAPKQEQNITNNNLIISTADLLKMIKGSDG